MTDSGVRHLRLERFDPTRVTSRGPTTSRPRSSRPRTRAPRRSVTTSTSGSATSVSTFMLLSPTRPRAGFTATVVAFLLDTVFADPDVQRLVAEPDARNDKAVRLVTRLGFELGPVVRLSTKPAQLAYLTRTAFSSHRSD